MDNYEYIPKKRTITFTLKFENDGLHLIHSNERFCQIIGSSFPYQKNELLSNYIDVEYYDRLVHICQKLTNDLESYQSSINIACKDRILPLKIHCFSIKHQDTTFYMVSAFEICDDINKNFFATMDSGNVLNDSTVDCIFTMQFASEDKIKLVDYNLHFLQYFKSTDKILSCNDLRYLLPPYIVSFLCTNSRQALSQNTAIRRMLNYHCTANDFNYPLIPPNKNFHIQVSFVPYSQAPNQKIVCCFSDMTGKIGLSNEAMYQLEEYNALFTSTVNSTAIFNCEDITHPKIERINVKMLELIVKTSILQEPFFYESKIFQKMIESKSTIEDLITIRHGNSMLHYKVILIPVIHDSKVIKSIFTIVDTTEQVNLNIKKATPLTPRESEVISYVLRGEKNDYIAQKLNVSLGTIKRTLFNAYNKLGISSRVELIKYYHSLN